MTKEIWINLPVKDVDRSKEFFTKIGFPLNEQQSNEQMACFTVGEKNMTVLFFSEDAFREFTKADVAKAQTGAEVLISFDAESREAVDETARKVAEAGGTIFSEPGEIQGWMYGFGFADPDGHRWNQVFMDFGKLPK
jgi:predicted lactoylglutathione lyase